MARSPQRPGTLVPTDGVLLVKSLRAMMPGERLTLNYGPADLGKPMTRLTQVYLTYLDLPRWVR